MKIFCIGLSKTGTTSLTEALKILGFDAVHWYATKHAFRYTDDGGIDIDWDFFERHDAFADTPIARIYPQLDERYPDAKFILTVRDTEAWLESFADQFAAARLDPFSARLHRDLYGTADFDAAGYRRAFLGHGDRIHSHFARRPGQLLRLDVTRPDAWSRLCGFLAIEAPERPFPHRFKRLERVADERAGSWSDLAGRLLSRLRALP